MGVLLIYFNHLEVCVRNVESSDRISVKRLIAHLEQDDRDAVSDNPDRLTRMLFENLVYGCIDAPLYLEQSFPSR